MRIVGVSSLDGVLYNPQKGLDIAELTAHEIRTGSITGLAEGDPVETADLLELSCDVLIPAAAAGQITADNAARIQAKVVAEVANRHLDGRMCQRFASVYKLAGERQLRMREAAMVLAVRTVYQLLTACQRLP